MPASTKRTEDVAPPRPPHLAAIGLPIVLGIGAVQAWTNIRTESVWFARGRLQQNIKAQHAILACTNLEDMRKVQSEFLTTAQEQYAAQTVKMMTLFGKAAFGLMPPSTARHFDDVPL